MKRRGFLSLALASVIAGAARAQSAPGAYAPRRQVSGSLRIWGHGALGKRLEFVEGLVGAWQQGFRRHQPGIVFDDHLSGTAAAIGALYTGQGELALMGREIWPPEIAAFTEVKGYPPTEIEVMTGSLDVRNKGYAIALFVHPDNPIRSLTLAQIDAIYSIERRRGHRAVSTWGDLGLTGAWADRPVHRYGFPIARGFAEFMEDRVFQGSALWNPALREFPDDANSVSVDTDGATRMLAALAGDPLAVAYAGLVYDRPGVRVLPIAEAAGSRPVLPTRASVRDRSYPLARIISMFLDLPPNGSADPKAVEFLRFVLSAEGQAIVDREGGGYLPLTRANAERQLKKLK